MQPHRQTYILRVWNADPTVGAASEVNSAERTAASAAATPSEWPTSPDAEHIRCSLQAIMTEEIRYFDSLEETFFFIRNHTLATRFKPK